MYYKLKDVNYLFEYDQIYIYNSFIESNKKLNIKELILIPKLNLDLILLKLNSKMKIEELHKLWSLLKKDGRMIILYLKNKNKHKLNCFTEDIKCNIIDKGLVVILEKL